MSRTRLIGIALVLVGLPTMIWSPGAWPILGVFLVIGGLALTLRDSVAAFRSSAPTPYAEMLWRRNAGGPTPSADPRHDEESASPGA